MAAIDAITAMGEVNADNYLDIQAKCEAARVAYNGLNVDDRSAVSNLEALEAAEAAVEAVIKSLRPDPVKTVIFNADELEGTLYDSTITENGFTLVGTSEKFMEKKGKKVTFTYADVSYSMTYGLSVGGSAKFGTYRYVSFQVEGACTVTIAVQSSGSAVRTLNMVDASGKVVGSFEAGTSVTLTSVDVSEAGTYSVGSAGSGMYIFVIVIEYFE